MSDLIYRKIASQKYKKPKTIDEENRSVEVVLATENGVREYDWNLGEIDVVLDLKSTKVPDQVVMLDSHSRWDTSSVIGSVRNIRNENNELVGTAYFDEGAQDQWRKVAAGHLTDFSIGYSMDRDSDTVIEGGKTKRFRGRDISGPAIIRKNFDIRELSLVPIGADKYAKSRSYNNNGGAKTMDEKMRQRLVERGLKQDATDDEAIEFINGLIDEKREVAKPEKTDDAADKPDTTTGSDAITQLERRLAELETQGQRSEIEREAINVAARMNIPSDKAKEIAEKSEKKEDVYRHALDFLSSGSHKVVTMNDLGQTESEKFRAAFVDGLTLRAGGTIEKPAPGAKELQGWNLRRMAEEFLRMSGENTRKYSDRDIAKRALATDDFPSALLDVMHKEMMEGYLQSGVNQTWRRWCGIGSMGDLRTSYTIKPSAFSDLVKYIEGAERTFGDFGDDKESFSGDIYQNGVRITVHTLINDDMGFMNQARSMMGEAAARKIDQLVYSTLNGNPTMNDGSVCFSTANGNLAASDATLSETTVSAAISAMEHQTDSSGREYIGETPQYFLAPSAKRGTFEAFWSPNSMYYAAQTANTGIYRDAIQERIYTPRLDSTNKTAYYFLGPKNKTVNVMFLNGMQTPQIEQIVKDSYLDGIEYNVWIAFAVHFLDHRFMYKNNGA